MGGLRSRLGAAWDAGTLGGIVSAAKVFVGLGVLVCAAVFVLLMTLFSSTFEVYVVVFLPVIYGCSLPGLLVPYAIFAVLWAIPADACFRKAISPGILYPACIFTFAFMVPGYTDITPEDLLETAPGWLVLIAYTFGLGTLLSWATLRGVKTTSGRGP